VTTAPRLPQVKRLASAAQLRARLDELGVDLPVDDDVDPHGVLAQPYRAAGRLVGNRFAILPMEGWDGTPTGRPTELVERRWRRFGRSGAKLIWGGEAVAVRTDGRANPHQLVLDRAAVGDLATLRAALVDEHRRASGTADDLVVGLQLTHSGRFARPRGQPDPIIAYHHPLLDARVGASELAPIDDDGLDELAADFVHAAHLAAEAGFDFVDIKHCHGYLLHELLGAVDRPGRYGGDFEGRTRFLRTVVDGVHRAVPGLPVGVRLSVFDVAPHVRGPDGRGTCEGLPGDYPYAFGGDGRGTGIDLDEPDRLLSLLEALGVSLVCTTAGSPYYSPHVQRPAYFPPSDGYEAPEDPLVGVARQVAATAELKERHPGMVVVGSAYTYLQEWLPHVAQAVLTTGGADAVGLGRMALSYPELPRDVLAGRALDRRRLCRTFSDCTTAPRNGLVSGCYPLDDFYRDRPERVSLARVKRDLARRSRSTEGPNTQGVREPRRPKT
jgi:NADPH2 dehydrogenase